MATKEKQKSDVGVVESELIRNLRAKREMSSDLYKRAEEVGNAFRKLDAKGKSTQRVAESMSKLDEGIAKVADYKGVIADIATGLTDELQTYTDFVRQTGSYEGIEKIVKIFDKQKAHRMRIGRMSTRDPEENLKLVQEYASSLIREILEVRKDVKLTYEQLKFNTDLIVAKIKEFQPQEETLKEKLDAMEAEYAALKDDASKETNAALQAEKQDKVNQMHEELAKVREEYDSVITVYKQAQDAYKISEQSRDSFEMMSRNLAMQAVMIQQKLDNLTPVYLAAPKARSAMYKTKGMEITDQAMNKAAEETLELTVLAAEGVAQSTTARAKTPTIDEQKMREFMNRGLKLFKQYGIDLAELSKEARKSEEERYGPKAEA